MAKKNQSVSEEPSNDQSISYEADPDTLVKIEFISLNGKPFYGQVTDDELLYIWVSVFGRKLEELFGTTSSKSLTRHVRAIFKLKTPTKLTEIADGPEFSYEKFLDDGASETITGKILGFNAVKPAELGDLVKVTIKTNFGVEAAGLIRWLKLYGIPTAQYHYQVNPHTGLKTDVFEAEIILKRHIEEFLPIFGQKAIVSYPGMPKQCNRCYNVGHLRRDCNNPKKDWVEYIASFLCGDFDKELIGTWSKAVQRWNLANESANKNVKK